MGFIPGVFLMFFILNKKDAGCSYLPNERVISESLSKNFVFSENFNETLKTLNLTEKFIRDSLIKFGKIEFGKSNAQGKPCPRYILTYPKQKPKYELEYFKCKENINLLEIKEIN